MLDFTRLWPHKKKPAPGRMVRGTSLRVEQLEDRTLLTLLGKSLFPADNPWNQKITQAPVAANSAAIISAIISKYGNGRLHPDFGQDYQTATDLYGIPYNVVHGNSVAKVQVIIDAYPDESDIENAPIPANAVLEGDLQNGPTVGASNRGDSHLLVWDEDNNIAYEFYYASRPSENSDGKWHASCEAVWNMNTDSFRTIGWTSADAAGLAILPGLVRPDEGLPTSQGGQGVINHAIRFTLQNSVILDQFIYPASHIANSGSNAAIQPPMGARFRLKASVDISSLNPESKIIAQAMKDYGLIVADNGSNFFFSGASCSVDAGNNFALTWNDNDIQDTVHGLKSLTFSDFEVVDLAPIVTGLSTASGPAGTQVTVTGQNFSGAAGRLQVFFGTTPATSVTVVDDGHVLAAAPAGSGTVDVTVQSGVSDPDDSSNINSPIFGYGVSAVSTADRFTYVAATPMTVTAANWTSAGLTLEVGSDSDLHVYVTGSTTNVVTARVPATVSVVQITAPTSTSASLTIDSTAGDPVPSGLLVYNGGGGLIKSGPGTVGLSDANGYKGRTVVSGGTLLLETHGALPDGAALVVGAGGTLVFDPTSTTGTAAADVAAVAVPNVADTVGTEGAAAALPSAAAALVGPLAPQHAEGRPPEQFQVRLEALVANVPEVHPRPFLEADVAAAADLPEARQPRLDRQAAKLPGLEAGDLADVQGTRTDERHLPEEHVEQLRRLIEARLPQDAAQPGDPWIAAILEDGPRALVGH